MPFGLCNGPASYSRLVQLVLQGIPPESALPYLDDTIVHSPSTKQHFKDLGDVLAAHEKAGLKLQPSKCQIFQSEVAYLGHLISQDGIRPLPDYVQAVKDWPIPTTKSEARVFLGKIGYYRRFIKDFQTHARHWTNVTGRPKEGEETNKEDEKLTITPEMRHTFELLKDKLLQAPILAYPQFDSPEPFILDTDWSQETGAIGGVLITKTRRIGKSNLLRSQEAWAGTNELHSGKRRIVCPALLCQPLGVLSPISPFHSPH